MWWDLFLLSQSGLLSFYVVRYWYLFKIVPKLFIMKTRKIKYYLLFISVIIYTWFQKRAIFCSNIYIWTYSFEYKTTTERFIGQRYITYITGFSNMWTMNFQMLTLDLEKAEEPGIKLLTSAESLKKQESSRKTSISALTMQKPLTVWITINCGKFWKRWEYQTTWPASLETCMQVRKHQLELDVEQPTGSK